MMSMQPNKIRNNLRDAFLCLDLDFSDTDHAFTRQVELSGGELTSFREIRSVDKRTIPTKLKPYLIKGDVLDKKRYEWHLYQRVNNAIGKGGVTVTESEKHKRWEDDLISEKDWKNCDKWIRKAVSKTDLLACIFANGTNYGLGNMATISDRSFATLRHTENSYVTLENIHKSKDRVANTLSKLPTFQYYNIEEDQLYASIDGQKFETRINTFKARYSSKYFKDKGVSAMTLSCNHVALNTTVIGANESISMASMNLKARNLLNWSVY